MKRVFILILVGVLQLSCSSDATPLSQPTATQAPQYFASATPVGTPAFEVVAWVSDADPQVGSRIMLYGSLLKYGVHLGGMAMRATWPDEEQERGVPNCSVQVIYGSGVCIIETEGYQPGVYIPITLTFEYQGKIYRGQTGFTPR